MTALLDVNVLIALFDPEHIHHDAAHAWFGGSARGSWATCPLTENGFVRIASNPNYPGRKTTVADAIQRLADFCESDSHTFWPDTLSLRERDHFIARSIRGHHQITDVYLLSLAKHNGGVLATFDRSIPASAVPGADADCLLALAPNLTGH